MPNSLLIRCQCGALEGVISKVSPQAGNHVACYCDDCQAFAHFLGRAADVLDAHGGSDIFQMSQGQVAIAKGADKLQCMRLSEKGLVRWYAGCCNTPIGNTMASSAFPFVGLVTTCLHAIGQQSVAGELGPLKAHIYRKYAKDKASLPADRVALPLIFFGAAALLLKWMLHRDGKRSPFFDSATGKLVASPKVLSDTERADLRGKVAAYTT